MKAVIFAGGFGSRISELTVDIPKPMARIGDLPIMLHLMNIYSNAGVTEFVIALGYKGEVIKDFFLNFNALNSDFMINLKTGKFFVAEEGGIPEWKVHCVDTGLNTATGGRLKRLADKLDLGSKFYLTYGDGLADINVKATLESHLRSKCELTMTVVRPPARFGEVMVSKAGIVQEFEEKPAINTGWVNGGFFVCNSSVIDKIHSHDEMWERGPLQRVLADGGINAFQHEGFWQCMDTKRDYDYLNKLWEDGQAPWCVKS